MRQPPLASFLRNQPLIRMAKMSGWFFHSEAVFPKLREFGFFPSSESLAFSQGGIPILKECIFKVGRKPWKLAYKGVPTTLKIK